MCKTPYFERMYFCEKSLVGVKFVICLHFLVFVVSAKKLVLEDFTVFGDISFLLKLLQIIASAIRKCKVEA